MNIKSSFFTRTLFFLLVSLLIACQPTTKDSKEFEYTGKPRETISVERAQELYRAYQERYDVLKELKGGEEDARYGWHSIDFYKNYIAYLEEEAAKVHIKISGIRLYYVAYPDNDSLSNQAGYQTFMYIPTYFDEKTQKNIAFDPLHMNSDGTPMPIHEILVSGRRVGKGTVSLVDYKAAAFLEETESSFANIAQMCKPFCE